MSLSSDCLINLTSFRNPKGVHKNPANPSNPWRVIVAEVGYIAIIPIAIVEAAIVAIAKLFSLCLPMHPANHKIMTEWLKSSALSIVWAISGAVINPYWRKIPLDFA